MNVLLLAVVLQVASGIAALLLVRSPRAASALAAGGVVAGCLLGLIPTLHSLLGGASQLVQLPWDATHGVFIVELDTLSAFFLLPVLGLSALAAVYGANYLLAYHDQKPLGSPWFFFNVFVGAMVMVLVARTVLLFLVAWEIMSIAAYCLVTFEHEKPEVRKAGWIYLVAAHLGVIFLFIAFLLLGGHAESLEFRAFHTMTALGAGSSGLVFVLALVGFGTKAGLVPFHVWLPEAHPAAPSHVSALMSGVMIKMGLYGMLRILTFLGQPAPWWGLTLATLGLLSSLVGISLALNQRDIKRLLAYSSIENMGLIALALGVGIWGWASHLPTIAVLGTTAALLHIWNHALMKGLMFFAAGSVVHATGTKDMEQLGGLMKPMPWTGNSMLVGAVAIAALPPLNGFVSKWLIYLSLMNCGLTTSNIQSLAALLSIGLLALIGGLTALAFVRLTGIVLLGSPRNDAAERAGESSPWMIAPMLLLVFLCLTVAVIPRSVVGFTLGTLDQILGSAASRTMLNLEVADGPLDTVGNINALAIVATLTVTGIVLSLTRKGIHERTWGCGYAKPTRRMQYTGGSFAEMVPEHLLPRFLRPRTTRKALHGLFPSTSRFESETPDPISERVYVPVFRRWADRFARLRILQQGKVHVYLVYIMLTVVLALAWASLRVVVEDDMSELVVLLGIGIVASSGLAGLMLSRHSTAGQWVTTSLAVFGAGLGLAGVVMFWVSGESRPVVLSWQIPGAKFNVAMDALSAVFLMPVFLISLLGSVYGLGYWKQTDHPENGRKLRLFYGTLTAGMALLVIARNSILFLFGWEVMALSAFFLITTEDHIQEVRESGWIYLVATHVATLSLFALFALLRVLSGSFAFVPLQPDVRPDIVTAIFVLAFIGFGLKAGIMPLHVWLPGAHTVAPSHVSAIMSGVILKMGVYGLVRVTSLVPHPPVEWGGAVLALGVVSGVLGVAFAIAQHDFKRLLAYHSVENIGIIVMGLGLALVGRSLNHIEWVVLGLSGALLHVWNHALFKALLFPSAGSVIHTVRTREIDHLGGLAKNMPWTALFFLVGAVAICGLPPLNGFVSELLIYLGLFGTLVGTEGPFFLGGALVAAALALIGSLAVACFVKVFGAVFLGTSRSDSTRQAHESPGSMIGPMGVLVVCCFLIGIAPLLVAPILGDAAAAWAPELDIERHQLAELAPLHWISIMGLILLGAVLLANIALCSRLQQGLVVTGITWGCGYVAPTARMQYTSSSFAQMLVGLFGWALRPRIKKPDDLPLFPPVAGFHSEVSDTILDEAVLPTFRFGAWLFSWFRVFQQGSIQTYLLYIFLTLLILLLWR